MTRSRITFVFSAAAALILPGQSSAAGPDSVRAAVGQFCLGCHDAGSSKGGLDLEAILDEDFGRHAQVWEKVVRKLRGRQMPPEGRKRPDERTYESLVSQLEGALDRAAADKPNPGRTETIRRLTRTEYQNAARGLPGMHIDAPALLPADEASHGFDNVTVAGLSPTLLDRYITAAQKISRLAVGSPRRSPDGETIRVKADITQEDRADGLPVGTRGGTLVRYTFPRDGEYEVQVRLTRDRNEHVEGLHGPHELEVLLDRKHISSFTVKPPPGDKGHEQVDAHPKARLSVTAGPHDLGVTFLKEPADLQETSREPYQSHFNMHRHPRLTPAVYQVTITGPFNDKGPGDTPSRRRLFVARPKSADDEVPCAKKILATVMRRAYRRPVKDADVERVLPFFREARRDADFDAGIEAALSAILVSREFLFRIERDPAGLSSGKAYRISDLDMASRLSFFLWSSIPDDELLEAAEQGELQKPDVIARQTRRMLADPRSRSLVTNFAAQWLHLR